MHHINNDCCYLRILEIYMLGIRRYVGMLNRWCLNLCKVKMGALTLALSLSWKWVMHKWDPIRMIVGKNVGKGFRLFIQFIH